MLNQEKTSGGDFEDPATPNIERKPKKEYSPENSVNYNSDLNANEQIEQDKLQDMNDIASKKNLSLEV